MAVAVLQGKGSFTIHLTLVGFHSSQITTMACNTYEESVKLNVISVRRNEILNATTRI